MSCVQTLPALFREQTILALLLNKRVSLPLKLNERQIWTGEAKTFLFAVLWTKSNFGSFEERLGSLSC